MVRRLLKKFILVSSRTKLGWRSGRVNPISHSFQNGSNRWTLLKTRRSINSSIKAKNASATRPNHPVRDGQTRLNTTGNNNNNSNNNNLGKPLPPPPPLITPSDRHLRREERRLPVTQMRWTWTEQADRRVVPSVTDVANLATFPMLAPTPRQALTPSSMPLWLRRELRPNFLSQLQPPRLLLPPLFHHFHHQPQR